MTQKRYSAIDLAKKKGSASEHFTQRTSQRATTQTQQQHSIGTMVKGVIGLVFEIVVLAGMVLGIAFNAVSGARP
jgi:hypothetical protein